MTTKEKIFNFAECLVFHSSGELELVKHEEDDSKDKNVEAATFLKWNGHRLGRDLELYAFMEELGGTPNLLCNLLGELLIPIKKLALSYKEGGVLLQEWGSEVFEGKRLTEWVELF